MLSDLYESCTKCNERLVLNSHKFKWSECKHKYCIKCVANIINESLSLLNEIPKCVYPDCNKLLNIDYNEKILKSISYPKKYQITINYKEYDNMSHLIHGYIRCIKLIPNDIISIIFEFYYLNIIKPIGPEPCFKNMTLREAMYLKVGDKIYHQVVVGRFVVATIIEKKGINFKIHHDGWSRKWDIWSNFLAETQRFAKYKPISSRPSKCDILTLDFKKICNKQLLCIKCNQYYPKKLIIHWTNCNHIVCIDCLLPFVQDEIIKNERIPICPAIECKQQLIGERNISFLYDMWNKTMSYKQFSLRSNSQKKLELLLYRRDKFECSSCNKWHKNSDLFINKDLNCNHKFSNECHDYWSSICGHSECINCCSKCEICQISSKNKHLIKWTLCGHKYHPECAKKYFCEWIPKSPSIFNEIIPNDVKLIPLCIHKDCCQFLDVLCAKKIGATKYQYRILYYLRKKSILIENNNDDDVYLDK